jgi:IS1 family transposase
MRVGLNRGKRYRKYKRLTEEQKNMIFKMYEEKTELRKIARILGVELRTVQYHLEKKLKEYKNLYNQFVKLLKEAKLVFVYLCIDELYTFIEKKESKAYVGTAVGVTKRGRKFYFYHLSLKKDGDALSTFNTDLPKVDKYYTDGHFAYDNVYGKKASQKKSKFTNIVENLNSQMRDKVSYLVRKTKAHAKSFKWLDNRLAMFFVNLNLKANKCAI